MKQNKIHCENNSQEYYDYSWLTTYPAENPLRIDEEIEELRQQLKELKRELKMHIDNCPYGSIKVK